MPPYSVIIRLPAFTLPSNWHSDFCRPGRFIITSLSHCTDVHGNISGASHVDDLSYLFYMPAFKTNNPDPPAECTKDRLMIERLTGMWTNFARTG